VSASVYPAGGFRRNEYLVRFGRVRSGSRQLYLSEFIPLQERDDLLHVLAKLELWLENSGNSQAATR
jgi:hypothetical protein